MRGGRIDGRIEGLNAWRAALLVGGLLIHGTVLKEPSPVFEAVRVASGSFRMGAFFAISGVLAAIILARRREPGEWLAERTFRIGIPTLFGLALLSPIISAILRGALGPAHSGSIFTFEWHHLWFLVALLAYQPLAWLVETRLGSRQTVRLIRAARALGQLRVLLLLAGISFVLMVLATQAVFTLAPQPLWPMLLECRLIAGYVPIYLFGMGLGRSRSLRAAMLEGVTRPLAILALVTLGYALGDLSAGEVTALSLFVGSAVCPPAAVVLILRSAFAMRDVPMLVHRLCAASFTIYLLHYPILLAINAWALRLPWERHVEYVLAMMVAGGISYALHFSVVRHSPLLSLLLNGRGPLAEMRRRRPARLGET